jgi:glyoxylase I family protein
MTEGAPRRMQIRGIHHVTLICSDLERTAAFYRDLLGLSVVDKGVNEDDPSARHWFFGDTSAAPGTLLSFLEYPSLGEGGVGVGSTHHIALRVGTPEELEAWREYLRAHGVEATEVLDRKHFRSIYLRDPDGHVIEIATEVPGFKPPVRLDPPPPST